MRAKKVYENLDFERGKDPKDALGIGIRGQLKYIDYEYNFDDVLEWTYPGLLFQLKPVENKGRTWVLYAYDGKDNPANLGQLILSDIPDMPEDRLIKYTEDEIVKYLRNRLNESQNFERGQDPKSQLGVGREDIRIIQKIQPFLDKFRFREEAGSVDLEGNRPSEIVKVWSRYHRVLGVSRKFQWFKLGKDEEGKYYFSPYNGLEKFGPDMDYDLDNWYKNSTWRRYFNQPLVNNMPPFNIYRHYEAQEFERGKDPKEAMRIGKAANPFVIEFMEEEYDAEGRVDKPLPEDHNQDTWFESCDSQETHHVLKNWKTAVDGAYYFYGQMKDNPDPDHLEHFHAPEINDEFVEYMGELYYIPDHKEYWDKIY